MMQAAVVAPLAPRERGRECALQDAAPPLWYAGVLLQAIQGISAALQWWGDVVCLRTVIMMHGGPPLGFSSM